MRAVCLALFDPGNASGSGRVLHRGTAQQPHSSASGFLARQKQRRQLRIVDGAATMQRRCVRVRAIAREALPQIGQAHIGAMVLDQARKADPPTALAAMAGDFEHHRSGSDSPWSWLVAIFRSMPLPDLTPEEYAEVVRLVRVAIDGDQYALSPRVKRLK